MGAAGGGVTCQRARRPELLSRSGRRPGILRVVMAKVDDFPGLRDAFPALEEVQETSIYRWAPVFRCTVGGRPAVLKRTASPLSDALGVAAWTTALAATGLGVVAPMRAAGDGRSLGPVEVGDVVWVVYPWIEGRQHDGTPADVAAAGELLGRLHAAGTTEHGLPTFDWADPDQESVTEDVDALRAALGSSAGALQALVRRFPTEVLPVIRDAGLPVVDASLDYKANNLVHTGGGPVLVDPDNSKRLPRLLDLGLAVLLFHSEHDHAPGRPFDATEWTVFRDAWLRHVRPTSQERDLWPTALEYMLSEWAVWQITDSDTLGEDSDDPRQAALLTALAGFDPHAYPLR